MGTLDVMSVASTLECAVWLTYHMPVREQQVKSDGQIRKDQHRLLPG
jgi:hypothetical protein